MTKNYINLIGALFAENIFGRVWELLNMIMRGSGMETGKKFSCLMKDVQGQQIIPVIFLKQVTPKSTDRIGSLLYALHHWLGNVHKGINPVRKRGALQPAAISSITEEKLGFLYAWLMQDWGTPWFLGHGIFFSDCFCSTTESWEEDVDT